MYDKIKNTINRRKFMMGVAGATAVGMVGSHAGIPYATDGNTLTMRTYAQLQRLDPANTEGGVPEYDINWAVLPQLIEYDQSADGSLGYRKTVYVESFIMRDETHIDFTLKPGFIWSNGYGEFTTKDVQYSYDRMIDSLYAGNFSAYDHIEIKDKYNATIVLKHASTPFLNCTLCEGCGVIVCADAVEAVGGSFTLEIPAICGPYLYEWKQNQYIRLKINPEWTGPKPAYANINLIFIDDHMAAALAYEAEEIDCTRIAPSTYVRYQKNLPPNSKLTVAGILQSMWLGMNQDHPKLRDIRVRKAIQHAVDASMVNMGAHGGTAEPSYGVVAPGLVGKRSASKYSYDPARAKALLAEAGVSGLELTLKTLNASERMLAATIIQANLQAVGIRVSVVPVDIGPYWEMGNELQNKNWQDLQLYINNWGVGADPFDVLQWFTRENVGVSNWERWTSEEYDTLFEEGNRVSDPQRRKEIYLRMQEIMEDTGSYVWLLHEPEVYVHRDDFIIGVAPTGETKLAQFRPV